MTNELIERIRKAEPDFKFGSPTLRVNYTLIPVLLLKPTNENMVLFNDILKYCRANNYQIIKRTENHPYNEFQSEDHSNRLSVAQRVSDQGPFPLQRGGNHRFCHPFRLRERDSECVRRQ